MADIKISELPAVSTVTGTDVFPVVATDTTSKLTVTNLAKSLPQVSSSVSASYALTAQAANTAVSASYATTASYLLGTVATASYALTASYAQVAQTASYFNLTGTGIVSSSAQFNNLASPITGSFTGSFVGDGSGLTGLAAGSTFPYTGSATITGSLGVVGPVSTFLSGTTYSTATSVGTIAKDQSKLSGSLAYRTLPEGYQAYYIRADESDNGKSTLYLYQVTSDGTDLRQPAYTSPITVVNKKGGNTAWLVVNPFDTEARIANSNGNIPSHSIAPGDYADLFLDTSNQSVQRWVVYRTGSMY